MNRPVAASAVAEAAVKDPHAKPSQDRRDRSGEVSSTTFFFFAGGRRGATAAEVVLPAKLGGTAGCTGFGGGPFEAGAPSTGAFGSSAI